jgi:hypothetical protein
MRVLALRSAVIADNHRLRGGIDEIECHFRR